MEYSPNGDVTIIGTLPQGGRRNKMKEVLKIENFILTFHGLQGDVTAIKGVDLALPPGQTLAIVGESGSGKTALCRAILRLHAAHAEVEQGRIMLCGKEVTTMTEEEMTKVRGKDVAMVFQDPLSSLNPVFSIGEQIAAPLMLHEGLSKKAALQRAEELLAEVGIDRPAQRVKQYPHQLSGGMRQRVAIAIALACQPKLLIADEPTTALDEENQKTVMDLLRKICHREEGADGADDIEKRDSLPSLGEKTRGQDREQERAVIFVTHDLRLAKEVADRIAVMQKGRIVEYGEAKQIFENPQHPYTNRLLRYANYGGEDSHYHGHIKESHAHGEHVHYHSCPDEKHTHDRTYWAKEVPVAEIKDLCKSFELSKKSSLLVLDNFSMKISQGEIVGVIGQSGCGKSTLARCLMGIYEGDSGSIAFAPGVKRQMVFQDSASAFNPRMTLRQIIAEPLVLAGKGLRRQERQAEPLASVGDETERRDQKAKTLDLASKGTKGKDRQTKPLVLEGKGVKRKDRQAEPLVSVDDETERRNREAEPLALAGKGTKAKNKKEIQEKVEDICQQVMLPLALLDRHPYDVSGGERQRAAIARALITSPDFLIADEPVSSLDVSIQADIIHLLKKLHDERHLTMMIISHDLPMVEHISDRIIQMG